MISCLFPGQALQLWGYIQKMDAAQFKIDRQQAMNDSRRALMLDAARVVFEKLGIEGASIREIAKQAGYTPGAIYSYFENKEAIYGALLADTLERLNAEVDDAGHEGMNPLKCWTPKPALGLVFLPPIRATLIWGFIWYTACGHVA